jgi:hypothetical protein
MKDLKAIIIENEYEVPGEIRGFIKDHPGLFSDVNEQCWCKDRDMRDVGRFIVDRDAVIVMSTFMYKWQLEQFVQAFAQGPFSEKEYKFFIFHFVMKLNDWNKKGEDGSYKQDFYFNHLDIMLDYLKHFIKQGRVFSIQEDRDASSGVTDNYWWGCSGILSDPNEIRNRDPWCYKKVCYSEQHDIFYLEGEDPAEEKKYYS